MCGVCSFIGAYFGATLVLNKRIPIYWQVGTKKNGETDIKPIMREKYFDFKKTAEFMEDSTQEELDEMSRPSKLRKFLNKFVKSNE